MTLKFIIGSAILLSAGVAAAQEAGATADATLARRRAEVEAQAAQAQGGGGRGGAVFARVPLEAAVVKGAPYSAEVVRESTQVLADGNRIVRRDTGRVYRDSQGRTRREDDIEPGRVGGISISDPVAGVVYSLDTQAKIAFKTPSAAAGAVAGVMNKVSPVDPAELERRRELESKMLAVARSGGGGGGGRGGAATAAPTLQVKQRAPGWDEKTEVLPARNIEGVMAEGKRVTRTIPAGAIGNEQPIVTVTEEWRSTELQVLVMTRTSDPRTGEYTYRLLGITRAEPAPSWFEVPADYTVRESGVRRSPSVR